MDTLLHVNTKNVINNSISIVDDEDNKYDGERGSHSNKMAINGKSLVNGYIFAEILHYVIDEQNGKGNQYREYFSLD